MTRFKLTLEYDGGPFVGWQRQKNGRSVQQALEQAIDGFAGEAVTVHGAGRTDAGVHATGQVAHFDLSRPTDPEQVRDALNHHLRPLPVSVLAAEVVGEDFHARFSATGRAYLYRIVSRRAPPALARGRAWWVPVRLDVGAMAAAARVLVGRHDFSTFRAQRCQAPSPVKTLDMLDPRPVDEGVEVVAESRSFLHHQVRNMVGTLKLVGEGKWDVDDVAAALAARDRTRGGPTAPAEGLYLTAIHYQSDDPAGPDQPDADT